MKLKLFLHFSAWPCERRRRPEAHTYRQRSAAHAAATGQRWSVFAAGVCSRVMLAAKRGVLCSCMFDAGVRSRVMLDGCALASLVLLGGPARPLASALLLDMSGASLLDSKASFKTKVLEYGLPVALFEAIARRGVDTLSKAAYAVGAPGVLP